MSSTVSSCPLINTDNAVGGGARTGNQARGYVDPLTYGEVIYGTGLECASWVNQIDGMCASYLVHPNSC